MNSDEVRRQWAERSGAYSPRYYAHHGPDERSEAVAQRLARHVDRDTRVLELGCSSGRHLAHLASEGFEDLAGIEVNDEAFAVMADAYPDLAAAGTFYCAAIEDVLAEFPDDAFDAVYSVETLQHVHPDADWVFEEIARVTGEVLVTVENEGDVDAAAGDPDESVDAPESPESVAPPESAESVDPAGSTGTAVSGVNYVDDGLPLYYRDWHAVFTDLGFEHVGADVGTRDVVRTFLAR